MYEIFCINDSNSSVYQYVSVSLRPRGINSGLGVQHTSLVCAVYLGLQITMTETDYKYARENFDLHRAQVALGQVPLNINRAGKKFRSIIREIEAKYNVTL